MAAQNLTNTKQDLIAALVQRELTETATLVANCRDWSSMAVKGAKQVEVPKLSQFTVQDRAFGAAAAENAPLTDATDVIALDKNKIVLFGYDSKDALQSTIEYKAEAIKRASTAHGRQINNDILTEWTSIAGLDLASVADITAANILSMREFLMKNFADMSSVRLIVAADQERAMLELPEFSRYEYRGVGPAPVINGQIGSVYGIPVQLNQQVADGQAFMVAPEGCGFAFQDAPRVEEDKALQYGTGGMQVAVDVLYGVGGLQLGEGVDLAGAPLGATLSPFVAKLAT